jgi:5-oxoprolinase (ATP-hydrolysing) subunit C
MSARLDVLDAGLGVSIQDSGRPGYRNIGVPLSGASDPVYLAAANALVGNAAGAPALEIRLSGPTLTLGEGEAARLALVGAIAAEIIDAEGARRAIEPQLSFRLRAGEQLKVGRVSGTAYLAVAGGFAHTRTLGSFSTYARAGLGGVEGRAPQRGDSFACSAVSSDDDECRQEAPPSHAQGPIRVMAGPQDDHFTPEALDAFTSAPFVLTPAMDRMGLRLEGPRLEHNALGADILSDGVVPGAIQVPGDGQPIILFSDGQTTGGYAKIATVIRADLPRLAHLRPGDTLRFVFVTRAEADEARAAQAETLTRWRAGIEIWREPGRIDLVKLYNTDLITGVTAGQELLEA